VTYLARIEEENTSIPLVMFVAHMYRLEDMVVVLSKLYAATINRGTMSYTRQTFLAREN
jgi:hypothetical protein